jgi:hypothetical protein
MNAIQIVIDKNRSRITYSELQTVLNLFILSYIKHPFSFASSTFIPSSNGVPIRGYGVNIFYSLL